MYRCHVCDAPALSNCECYTQMEGVCFGGTIVTSANEEKVDHHFTVPVRHPSEQAAALKRASAKVIQMPARKPRVTEWKLKNIASGEDAFTIEEVE